MCLSTPQSGQSWLPAHQVTAHSLYTGARRMHSGNIDKGCRACNTQPASPQERASVHGARRPAHAVQGRGLATRAGGVGELATNNRASLDLGHGGRCLTPAAHHRPCLPTLDALDHTSHPSSPSLFNLALFESTFLFLPLLIAHPRLNRSLPHTKHTPSNFRSSPPSAQLSIPLPPHAPSP